jgi:hypothetical protein
MYILINLLILEGKQNLDKEAPPRRYEEGGERVNYIEAKKMQLCRPPCPYPFCKKHGLKCVRVKTQVIVLRVD